MAKEAKTMYAKHAFTCENVVYYQGDEVPVTDLISEAYGDYLTDTVRGDAFDEEVKQLKEQGIIKMLANEIVGGATDMDILYTYTRRQIELSADEIGADIDEDDVVTVQNMRDALNDKKVAELNDEETVAGGENTADTEEEAETKPLTDMTKNELIAYAEENNIDINVSDTKAQILSTISSA